MDEALLRKLVGKYLEGNCSTEEKAIVEAWYRSFDSRRVSFESLSEKQKSEVGQMMYSRIRRTAGLNKASNIRYRYYYAGGMAAAILVLIFALGVWIIAQRGAGRTMSSDIYAVVNTGKNIRHLVLPDSSSVWLYPGSAVRYDSGFKSGRDVWLTGDAFFDVQKQDGSTFVVRSNLLKTTVLGTSFRVRGGENEISDEVIVKTGKVSVKRVDNETETAPDISPEQKEFILQPMEKVTFLTDGEGVREKAGSRELSVWERSSVSFDNVEVKYVLEELSKVFDVEIAVSDPKIDELLLKADFTDSNLAEILKVLESSLYITYEMSGNQILLKPENELF